MPLTPKEAGTGAPANYFGDGSDGALSTSGDVSLASTQDGDAVVMQYTDLTINEGDTLTVANRCRGLIVFCTGDCVVNGALSMTARGCKANPADSAVSDDTPVAPSDGNAIPEGGVVLRFRTDTGTDSNADTDVGNGLGIAARDALQQFPHIAENGVVFAIPRVGGAGGSSGYNSGYPNDGVAGSSITNGTGGGGQGADDSSLTIRGGFGGAGTCFSGGAGGGGNRPNAVVDGYPGSDYGGAGGAGQTNGAAYNAEGGSGNPGGEGVYSGPDGGDGTGGLLLLIVAGTLTIGAAGQIVSEGIAPPQTSFSGPGGGGSGGGVVGVFYGDSLSNAGTISAAGGEGGGVTTYGKGGAGGDGAVIGPVQIIA